MKKQDKNVCKSCSWKSPWKRVKKVEEEEVYDHDLLFRFCCLAAVLLLSCGHFRSVSPP